MPKPYIRKMPATWWLRNRAYFWFMMRELTAVFMAVYCVILLVMLYRMKQGNSSFFDFLLTVLENPLSIAFHFLAFVAAMYHTMTWFALVPKVFVIRMGEEKAPPILLVLGHWVGWLVVTAFVIWAVFGLSQKL